MGKEERIKSHIAILNRKLVLSFDLGQCLGILEYYVYDTANHHDAWQTPRICQHSVSESHLYCPSQQISNKRLGRVGLNFPASKVAIPTIPHVLAVQHPTHYESPCPPGTEKD